MKFEKFINSRFYHFIEWLYRLIILNFLCLLTSILGLVIIGLTPSLIAVVTCIKTYAKGEDFNLFKGYFNVFFRVLKRSIPQSLFFFGLIFLQIIWVYYFYCWINESYTLFLGILYYFSLFLSGIVILAWINSIAVYVYFPYLSLIKRIKYSFVLLFYLSWRAFLLIGLIVGLIYLNFLFVYAVIFISLALLCLIIYLLTNSIYIKLVKSDEKSLDVESIKCQNMN